MRNYFAVSAVLGLVFATAFFMLTGAENPENTDLDGVQKFQSEQSFRDYVSTDSSGYQSNFGRVTEFSATQSQDSVTSGGTGGSAQKVTRSSDTNIQVAGVKEPDILKNGGEKIFYSSEGSNYGVYYDRSGNRNASVFNTLPAENFSKIGELPEEGRMFLTESSVIFLGDSVTSYDREGYEQNWEQGLNSTVESARRINDSIYLVLRENVDTSSPCPVRPMASVSIPCTDFYRPPSSEGGQTAYTLVRMNAETGEIAEKTGFVGSAQNTVVYMSENSIYLTYYTQKSEMEVMVNFLEAEGSNYLDAETMDRIEEVQTYNISDQALRIEVERAIRGYRNKLSDKEADEFMKEFQNAWSNYTNDRKRQLSSTGIAEFNRGLELEAEGSVPGEVNDQFSLSEKNGDFRIATTVGSSWQFDAKSANDLYVLNDELERKGEIQGLGLTERIYSVRYVDDKAYVVTFRRVDPFHVIDLSDPSNPELNGELKLPGFSSYLHPLSEDRILGIGEEDGRVKAVIFDVSGEPSVEESKVLDDWYSEISDSHHAFKIDRKHEVFFLPGSEGGHVFDYSEGLEQVKEVNMTDVKRATYVNDNLYVFGDYNATVVDENSWKTVKKVQFAERRSHIYEPPVIEPPVVR